MKKLVRPIGQLILAAVIGGAVPSIDSAALLDHLRLSPPAPPVELIPLAEPQNLRGGYRLPIAEVPEPPPDVVGTEADLAELSGRTATSPPRNGCPVELRAVVAGIDGGLAVVAPYGGDDSTVVGVGDSFATPNGPARVEAIASRHLTLALPGKRVTCELGELPAAHAIDPSHRGDTPR